MFARSSFFLTLGLMATGTPWAAAATVTFTPEVAAILNADFSPVDPALILPGNRLAPSEEPYLLQVDVHLRLSELGGLLGLQRTAFDVQLHDDGAALSSPELGVNAWTPDNPIIDINGPNVPGGGIDSKWIVNRDGGADPQDLVQIELLAETRDFGPEQFDIRRTIGQHPDNEIAGTFYIELPGAPGSHASADILTPYETGFYDANGETHLGTAIGLSTATYSVVPEPASWGLLTIGAALTALARRYFDRRR